MKKKTNVLVDTYQLFLEASELWDNGQANLAFPIFLKAAEMGDSSSQHNVGYMYDIGDGIEKDSDKALLWYKRAWKNDRQSGTCGNIALLYESLGNIRQSIYWWKKAIKMDDGDAALGMAKLTLKKEPKNIAKILYFLEMAMNSTRITASYMEEAKLLHTKLKQKMESCKIT